MNTPLPPIWCHLGGGASPAYFTDHTPAGHLHSATLLRGRSRRPRFAGLRSLLRHFQRPAGAGATGGRGHSA